MQDGDASRFGPMAARLAGQVCLLIGWHPARFWAATPAELASVLSAAALMPGSGLAGSGLAGSGLAGSGIDRATFDAMLERENNG